MVGIEGGPNGPGKPALAGAIERGLNGPGKHALAGRSSRPAGSVVPFERVSLSAR